MFSDRWNGFIYWLVIHRPIGRDGPLLKGALAYAGYYLHAEDNPLHTHSFVEVAFAVGGAGTLAFSLPPASTRRE